MYLTKDVKVLFSSPEFFSNELSQNWHTIEIPALCPNCGVGFGPTSVCRNKFSEEGEYFYFFTHKCNICFKYCLTLQIVSNDRTRLIAAYPKTQLRQFDQLLRDLSPEFIDMYQASLSSEQNGYANLAGIGYRSAMELLIKDYALDFELSSKEDISRLNLNRAIDKFFGNDKNAMIPADVVRTFGNNFAHWDKSEKYADLETLKAYLDLVVQFIYSRLMIKHPPVKRDKGQKSRN